MEEWREVAGYDGWYEVSTLGRVRSWRGPNNMFRLAGRRDTPLVMAPGTRQGGYLHVGLTKDGRTKYAAISRLVLTAFRGACPGMEACHNNGVNTDNHLSNLRWDTRLANAADKKLHGTQFIGEAQPAAKLTEEAVREARGLADTGDYTMKELATKFGVSKTTMWLAVRGKTWSHV